MPIVKAEWKDEEHIIRDSDMENMLTHLEDARKSASPLTYQWVSKKGEPKTEKIFVNYAMVKCLLCLLYVFGRRLSGILRLKRGDFWQKKDYLYVRCTILKKTNRKQRLKPKTRVKRVNIKKQLKYVQYILKYIETLDTPEMYLFPGRSKGNTKIIVKKKDDSGNILKTYQYNTGLNGSMSRQKAFKIIKATNPKIYPHWFRHSLATQLAEEGIDPWQLMNWFDWDRFATAKGYVSGTPAMTRDISDREAG